MAAQHIHRTGLALAAALALLATPLAAQQVQLSIPGQPLATALTALGRSTGLQIVYPAALTAGKTAPALQGSYAPADALAVLLNGSGLSWSLSGGNRVTLFVPQRDGNLLAEPGQMLLDQVALSGQSAFGAIDGYIATGASSGSKSDIPLIETPQSVTVIPRDQVEAQGAQSLSQALRYSAGVIPEVRGTNSRYDPTFVRGFGAIGDTTAYVDGLTLQRGAGYAYPQAEVWGMERIEVLKGPASVLYGSALPGGLVNLVSKRPGAEPRREIEISSGSYQRKQLAFDLGGAVSPGSALSYRLVGLVRDARAEVRNARERRYYFAPSLTWAPSDATSLTVLGSFQRDPAGGYYGVLPTVGTLWPSAAGPVPRDFNDSDPLFSQFTRNQNSIGTEFRHRFSDSWSLQHNLRAMHLEVDTRDLGTFMLGPDQRTIHRYAIATDETVRGVTSDLRLEGRFATGAAEHRVLIGYDAQYNDWRQQNTLGLPVAMGGTVPAIDYLSPVYGIATGIVLNPNTDQRQRFRQHGIYLQDHVKIGALSLLAGLRYDTGSIHTRNNLTATSQQLEFRAWSGRVGAIYEFGNGVAPYVNLSTSFQPMSGTDTAGNLFRPSTGRQVEVGVKYQPQDFDGFFSLALFDITQRNVVNTINPVTRFQTGKQRARGIEFEGRAALGANLNVIGALSLTHARVLEGMGQDVGSAPVNVPRATASVWLDYAFRSGALDGLTLGGGARYIGPQVGGWSPNAFTAGAQRLDLPGYTVVDAALSWDLGTRDSRLAGTTFRLNVNNLLDKSYVTCNANNFCNYGHGRTLGASLSLKW